MPTRLIISDFDRTLFNLKQFFADLTGLLAQNNLLNQEGVDEANRRLHDMSHPLHIGRFLKDYGCRQKEVSKLINMNFKPNQYVYKDVYKFLKNWQKEQIIIITTGDLWTQKLKLGLCPLFKDLPIKILNTNKGEYLKANLEFSIEGIKLAAFSQQLYKQVYLVDDNPGVLVHLLVLKHVKLFHIYRNDGKYPYSEFDPTGIKPISSLEEVT
jgi:hypothetical protein